MKFILYSTFLLLLAPCNASKKVKATDTNLSGQSTNLKTVMITFQKTVCFGTCPAFTLTINGEKNSMTYKGDLHVEKIGLYEKTISDEELTSLVKAFEKYKFFELKDAYTTMATDFPSRLITYSIDGKTKKVEDRQNAPAELRELEKILDQIADGNDWKKVTVPE